MPLVDEEQCDSVLKRVSESFFSIRTFSTRQYADLYRGCQFDCAYCFAASYKRGAIAEQDQFGHKIQVLVNGPSTLREELNAQARESGWSRVPEYTCLGITTDPYQPIERKYELTRQCLKTFIRAELPVTVLTKSNVCQRDIDLWSQLAKMELAAVGFTLTTPTNTKRDVKRVLEPFSPPTSVLLRTLESFVKAGIKTYVFVDPIVPFLTDDGHELSQLFREISNTGTKKVHFGVLKLTPATWRRLRSRLRLYDDVVSSIENLYFAYGVVEFGNSWLPCSDYLHPLYEYARAECQSVGLGFSCEGRDYDLWQYRKSCYLALAGPARSLPRVQSGD